MSHAKDRETVRCYNRIKILLLHASKYSFDGQARLATDIGVSRSTISRIMSGRSSPSLRIAQAITDALSDALGKKIQPEDIFSPDGYYDEPSTCKLVGCRGCTDEKMFDRSGRIKPEYAHLKPGDWTRFPERPKNATLPEPNITS